MGLACMGNSSPQVLLLKSAWTLGQASSVARPHGSGVARRSRDGERHRLLPAPSGEVSEAVDGPMSQANTQAVIRRRSTSPLWGGRTEGPGGGRRAPPAPIRFADRPSPQGGG